MSTVQREPEGQTHLVYRHRRTSTAQVPESADHEEAVDRLGEKTRVRQAAGRRGMEMREVSIWCVVTT